MKSNDWKTVTLDEIVEFNPRESIKKGAIAKKIPMEKLVEFSREVAGYDLAPYKGGTKFRNGDTLQARITPCLENGKTAYIDILEEDEIAFGSTEYNVWRAKEGISDAKFLYYLSISSKIREASIQSMTGSTGRQRTQIDTIKNIQVNVPEIEQQKQIGELLSKFDDKISLNNKSITKLENTSKLLFKHWFIDFEFPNEEGQPYKSSGGEIVESELGMIPNDWSVTQLDDVVIIKYGKNLPTSKLINEGYRVYGGNGVIGYYSDYLYEEPVVLVACRGAASGKVIYTHPKSFVTNNSLILETKEELLLKDYLREYSFYFNFFEYSTGSAQPQITINNLKNAQILLPNYSIQKMFSTVISKLRNYIYTLEVENIALRRLRDTLLPKLLSGEIVVPVETEPLSSLTHI